MKNRVKSGALCAVLLLSGTVRGAVASPGFTFEDIHYWVGEGERRCAVVIDWTGADGAGGVKAWGFRWRGGTACFTNLAEVVRRVANEDPRLTAQGTGFFGYDVNDVHCRWNFADGTADDPAAWGRAADGARAWRLCGPLNASALPDGAELALSAAQPGALTPADGDWFVFAWRTAAAASGTPVTCAAPAPAESPYGYEVVDSYTEDSWYNLADAVLGHPQMYEIDNQWGNFVVNPCCPAYQREDILSLAGTDDPGSVTIKFDHDVVDDPNNPFGIDFIVFGNSFGYNNDGEYYFEGQDPAFVGFCGLGGAEDALVEVSQDGVTWHAFAEGPFADGMAPTLGYRYEPENADPSLFVGNVWWGDAASATRPVDPSVTFADFGGMTLAQICRYYNGSAGGTGYDISRLPLPTYTDGPKKGLKWFRYVRVSSCWFDENEEGDSGYTVPEVDAVADVAPVSGYAKWAEANYTDWTTAWDPAVSGATAVAPNGLKNALCCFLGIAPGAAAPDGAALRVTSFTPGGTCHRLTVETFAPVDVASCGVAVKAAAEVRGPWRLYFPTVETETFEDGVYKTTLTVPVGDERFFLLSLDAK